MTFEENRNYWSARRKKLGDSSVGRKGEDHVKQGLRIAKRLMPHLNKLFEHGLDFGCGYGRMTASVAPRCGHLWCADIFEDWGMRAASGNINATPLVLDAYKLPFEDGGIDLILDIMTTQGFAKEARAAIHKEFSRIGRGGAKLIALTNGDAEWVDQLEWVVDPTVSKIRDVDEAGDEYCLIVGCLL